VEEEPGGWAALGKAIASASRTSFWDRVACIAQPTIRREKRSSTIARCSQPWPVRTEVMSETQQQLGAGAQKQRWSRSGAAGDGPGYVPRSLVASWRWHTTLTEGC
jgi:hypothetical protein